MSLPIMHDKGMNDTEGKDARVIGTFQRMNVGDSSEIDTGVSGKNGD
jgi:hypothetical protein